MDDINQSNGEKSLGASVGGTPAQSEYQQGTPSNLEGVGSTIATALSTVEEYTKPQIVSITEPDTGLEIFVVLTSAGVSALPESLFDEYRMEPKHRRGTASLLSLDSFIGHVNRFKDDGTVIFADNNRATPSLTAVLDYHLAGADSGARFAKHRSAFAYPLSDEWKAWQEANDKPMKMIDFAHFLEDRIIDVMPTAFVNLNDEAKLFVDTLGGTGRIADPAKLMQLATELSIYEASTVRSANNLSTGEGAIEFQSEHMDAQGQKLVVPSLFVLGIPVFKNGPTYQIIARLRYRKNGGTIVFYYELWRTDRVFDHAFDESVKKVEADTGALVLLGRDESKQPA